ncbi:ATP-dependent DNA helicase, RecQ family [Constantimarinum furrinae]|uniref:ATP-dependent DNA helicase RecQ n=2 Tax=Constantimarinum furrinae TaxID=2562285 RepID=A0A7G8PW58_9FLAO|nr:ATP-dependent DNA helicase, RecQ family [Constantimarinum furrinae]
MQEEIINSVLDGKDTVALLPTGGGKSICFQIPALAQEGICIVVSPLVALMTDQVKNLKEKGIKALAISGGISTDELRTLLDNAIFGNYKFLYVSPERLQQEMVQYAIREMKVNLIAVDEAHCISQWGNDFRPAYKNITQLRTIHPLVPVIALTATATPEVLEDTITSLKMELPKIFKESFYRDNLAYEVLKEDDKLYRIEQLLKDNQGSAIVYVRSRSTAVETCKHLNALGIPSAFYHGGIAATEKNKKLEQWKARTTPTIVATNAFGMGIDNPNVNIVIHSQLPESIESYFQEAGRAGRNDAPARAVLIYNDFDKTLVKKQFVDALPDQNDLKLLYNKLNNYFQISYGEGEYSEHNFNFSDFCSTYDLNSLLTFNGLNTLDRLGVIQLSKSFGRKTIAQFLIPSESLLNYFEKDMRSSVIGKTMLRIYGGIFETPTPVNIDMIAKKTGQSVSVVIATLKKMEHDQVLTLNINETDASITFLVPREDDRTINRMARDVSELNAKKAAQVAAVLNYIENNQECRSVQLLRYFGETGIGACGKCSVCTSEETKLTRAQLKDLAKQIVQLLKESPMTSRKISETLTFTENNIIIVLNALLDSGKVRLNAKNQFQLNE